MPIVPLVKMTIYGAESERDAVLDRLQRLGCVHIIDLSSTDIDADAEDDVLLANARDALQFLKTAPDQRRQVRRKDQFDLEQVIGEAMQLKTQYRQLRDERDELQKAIKDLLPWGEFDLPDAAARGHVAFHFQVVAQRDTSQLEECGRPYSVISRDAESVYVVILGDAEPDDLPGNSVQLSPRPLSQLRLRLEEVEEQLEEIRHKRSGLSRWCHLLAGALDHADDETSKAKALRQTFVANNVFALQGWIPTAATDQLVRFANENQLAIRIENSEEDDDPPTLLHNQEALAGSEGLVTFYKTPDYRAWDPSVFVFFSFAIFFAMIMADAGYGLILAAITAGLWRKLGASTSGRRTRNVLATIAGFTIAYGVLCGSYFGVTPSDDSWLARLRILDAQSQALMMPLTIIIGVIHLSVANVVMAWLHRGRATALASLGWVVVMIGATLAGVASTLESNAEWAAAKETATQAGAVLLIAGLGAVFFFSSQQPLLTISIKAHLLRLVDGAKGLTGVSSLFGDVLSYLRLFALGLSGAKLSETFNNLATESWNAAGFGVIGAIAIVILGHALNLLLCIMSGVVHGLRLNCIEFFKWGLPDEGYSFKAFAKKAG